MSKGNVNTSGNRKNNFPYQQSVLLLLGALKESSAELAQESTLISVLNAISANSQDIEILLVRDEAPGNGGPVVKQVTNYTTGVPVVTYENVDGTTYVPTPNPPQYVYLDPSAVLNLILADTTVLATPVTGVATSLVRDTTGLASFIPAGKRTLSFFNAGNTDAEVNGTILRGGESITYPELSNRDLYGVVSYNSLTSELVITTVG